MGGTEGTESTEQSTSRRHGGTEVRGGDSDRGQLGQAQTGDTEGTEQSTSRRHGGTEQSASRRHRDLERSSVEDVTSRRLLRRLQFHRAVPLAMFATAPQGAGPHAVGRIALRSGRVKGRVQLHAADLVCSTCPHIPVSAVSSAASCREVRAHCVVPPRSSPCLRGVPCSAPSVPSVLSLAQAERIVPVPPRLRDVPCSVSSVTSVPSTGTGTRDTLEG